MKFKENYIDMVVSVSISRQSKNIPNAIIATRIGCKESDIEEWRKKHILFDFAFKEPEILFWEKIWRCALNALDTRKSTITTYDKDGKVVSREVRDVLTTSDDILCAKQLLDDFKERQEFVSNVQTAMQKRK